METPAKIDYIARSKASIDARFAETRRLLAAWQEAYRTWQVLGTQTAREAMQRAHEAYKAEQGRALNAACEEQRQSLSCLQRAAA